MGCCFARDRDSFRAGREGVARRNEPIAEVLSGSRDSTVFCQRIADRASPRDHALDVHHRRPRIYETRPNRVLAGHSGRGRHDALHAQSLRYYGIKIVKRAFAHVRRAVAIAADRERRLAERFEPFVQDPERGCCRSRQNDREQSAIERVARPGPRAKLQRRPHRAARDQQMRRSLSSHAADSWSSDRAPSLKFQDRSDQSAGEYHQAAPRLQRGHGRASQQECSRAVSTAQRGESYFRK